MKHALTAFCLILVSSFITSPAMAWITLQQISDMNQRNGLLSAYLSDQMGTPVKVDAVWGGKLIPEYGYIRITHLDDDRKVMTCRASTLPEDDLTISNCESKLFVVSRAKMTIPSYVLGFH